MRRDWYVRFDRNLLPIVEQIALQEDRSTPDTCRRLMLEALRARGLLKIPPAPVDVRKRERAA